MSYLSCCCYRPNDASSIDAGPTHNCVMEPIVATIIEWENSDYCAVRVVAFAIKFFGSLILIGSIVGIWPWMCAHEEYILQKLEGRVEPLHSPASVERNLMESPLVSGGRSSQLNSAELRASLEKLSASNQKASPAAVATPEYYKEVLDVHESALALIAKM